MRKIYRCIVFFSDKDEKLVKTKTDIFKFSQNSDITNLRDGDTVFFLLEKRFFSTETNVFAVLCENYDQNWDKVYQNFIISSNNHSLLDYQNFLKTNYVFPSKIHEQ